MSAGSHTGRPAGFPAHLVREDLRGFAGRDVAGNDLNGIRQLLHPLDGSGHVGVVAVRSVDDDAVAAGVDEGFGAGEA